MRYLFVTHRTSTMQVGSPPLDRPRGVPGCPLTVHATPRTLENLRELLSLTSPGVEEGCLGERLTWRELVPGRSVLASDTNVTPFEVDYGLECVGFLIAQGGSKVVHTADTCPCRNVVEHVRGADLLIHDAYGTDDNAEQAHAFGHSTEAEAGKIAREAGAGRLVLTHLRAEPFADPAELAAEAVFAFGGLLDVARDLDAYDF